VGLSLRTTNELQLLQSFGSQNQVNRQPPFRNEATVGSSSGNRRYFGTASAWLGLGQVRDATPVQQAHELEARLLRTGALTRALSDEARQKLAALYAVGGDLGRAHERPEKYFWRELERVLREDGALAPGSLDAYDVLRLFEPISPAKGTFFRRTGFFVGPAVTVATNRDHATFERTQSATFYTADTVVATASSSFQETENFRSDVLFTSFQAEFHRPLNPRWQLDSWSSVGIRESGEFPFVQNALSLGYLHADRWLGIVRADQSAQAIGHSRHLDRWDVNLGGELYYFLEDSWALRFVANERQSRAPGRFDRRGDFALSLTWIVSGLFEAPGLVGAMRPTPPTP
jgi:hypothetical protein